MTERLRIDDLARASGLTVDTIRYYQREGLLPPGERAGRHRVYGPQHLRRLARIRELQARRFSIGAIRALVSGDARHLEEVFADEGEGLRYTYEELIDRSGISAELATILREDRVLRDPHEFGRVAYDGDDLDMLRTMARLEGLGIPTKALRALARIYAQGIEATQRRVVELFVNGRGVDWAPGELEQFQAIAAAQARDLLPLTRRLVDYTHHRTIQRLALDALAGDPTPGPGAAHDATAEDDTDLREAAR